MNISKIVVPVDLEKHTDKLVDYALFMAKGLDAELVLVHAVEFIVMGEMALGNPSYDDYNTSRKEHAQKVLADITANAATKCRKCSSKVMVGDVVDEILGFAKKEGGDLIIIGSHGKRGLEKILLGSVAERVLKNAHCPVLIMNPYK